MSSQTTAPPVADDVAFVLGLPADRQSAVLSALLRGLTVKQGTAGAIPISAVVGDQSFRLGQFTPDAEVVRYLDFLDTLSPESREMMTRPLPADFDPDDYLSDEEMEALRDEARAVARRSEPTAPAGGSVATGATATSVR